MTPMRRPTAARYAWVVVGLCCFFLVAVSLSPNLSRGSVKTPFTDWFESHPLSLFAPTRRQQLRSLLSSLGPEPDVPDRSEGEGIRYTDVHPGKVCVFQADDRALQTPKSMSLDDPSFIRSNTPEEAWALHYGHSLTYWHTKLWTVRHGYRLLRLPSEEVPGRVPLWSKIPPMLRMTRDRSCDYLVWMDSDVYVRAQEYSLMDMRRRWGMHDGHIIAVAKDATDVDGGYNTGFLILRGGDRAEQLIQDWLDCPDKVAGCEHWKGGTVADQGVFGFELMPKLLEEEVVTEIPCMEATGNTKSYDYGTGCNGTIVTHEWLNGKQVLAQEIISLSAFQLLSMVEQADD
ncbi:hypothetical protein JCM24511_08411 [Saitozyma sp. JCM 24511]|nr:hypothetical protein JCM24511_08411 [Saitozyma sp. JCM 24511]